MRPIGCRAVAVLLSAACCFAGAESPAAEKTWTDARGVKITGEFVRVHEGQVILRGAAGKMVKLPLSQFSEADQQTFKAEPTQANELPIREEGPSKEALARVVPREWQETSGRAFNARLVNFKDGKLVFQPAEANKRPLFLAFDRLIAEDQREARLQLIDLGLTERLWPIKRDAAIGPQVNLPEDASLIGGASAPAAPRAMPPEPDPVETPPPAPAPDAPPAAAGPLALDPPPKVAAANSPAPAKTWTDLRGVKITGDFVRVHEGQVIFNRRGKMVKIPLSQFSDADQQAFKTEAAQANELPIREEGPSKEALANVVPRDWREASGHVFNARLINFKDGKLVFQPTEANKKPIYLAFERLIPAEQQQARLELIDLGLTEKLWPIQRDTTVSPPTPLPDDASLIGGVPALPSAGAMRPEPGPVDAPPVVVTPPEPAASAPAAAVPSVAPPPKTVPAPPLAVAKTWTDVHGVKITGEFVRVHEGQVIIRRVAGKMLKLPLSQFSEADQQAFKAEKAETVQAKELPIREDGPSKEALAKVVPREWRETSGQSLNARLVNFKDGKLVFQPAEANKKPVFLAFERLIPEDQREARLQLIDLGLTERLWPIKRDATIGSQVNLPEDAALVGGLPETAPTGATPAKSDQGEAAPVRAPAPVAPPAP